MRKRMYQFFAQGYFDDREFPFAELGLPADAALLAGILRLVNQRVS